MIKHKFESRASMNVIYPS